MAKEDINNGGFANRSEFLLSQISLLDQNSTNYTKRRDQLLAQYEQALVAEHPVLKNGVMGYINSITESEQ